MHGSSAGTRSVRAWAARGSGGAGKDSSGSGGGPLLSVLSRWRSDDGAGGDSAGGAAGDAAEGRSGSGSGSGSGPLLSVLSRWRSGIDSGGGVDSAPDAVKDAARGDANGNDSERTPSSGLLPKVLGRRRSSGSGDGSSDSSNGTGREERSNTRSGDNGTSFLSIVDRWHGSSTGSGNSSGSGSGPVVGKDVQGGADGAQRLASRMQQGANKVSCSRMPHPVPLSSIRS